MKDKVLIAGGSGLVGQRLSQLLVENGYEVVVLSRSKKKQSGQTKFVFWNPKENIIDDYALTVDHIINLAGAGIADRPWTRSRKEELINSRLKSTGFLYSYLSNNTHNIKTYIGASAIGYYGDGENDLQTEDQSPAYPSFMTNLCKDWEAVHFKLSDIIDSVSVLRIGIVLSTLGGAYPKMRIPFKLGLGSYFGNGSQYYSWIHIDDLARIFIHLLKPDSEHGIYNAVSPDPKTNKELVKTIKDALELKCLIVPTPTFTLKLAMGEMSKVILNSNRVSAEKIKQTGFNFQFPELEYAIKDIEKRSI